MNCFIEQHRKEIKRSLISASETLFVGLQIVSVAGAITASCCALFLENAWLLLWLIPCAIVGFVSTFFVEFLWEVK